MEKKETVKTNHLNIIKAFGDASKLSFDFVFFPVVFLLIGVYLDKKFSSTPLFIISGVAVGIGAFVYKVKKALKEFRLKDENHLTGKDKKL